MCQEVVKYDHGGIVFGDGPDSSGDSGVSSGDGGEVFVFECILIDSFLWFIDCWSWFYSESDYYRLS